MRGARLLVRIGVEPLGQPPNADDQMRALLLELAHGLEVGANLGAWAAALAVPLLRFHFGTRPSGSQVAQSISRDGRLVVPAVIAAESVEMEARLGGIDGEIHGRRRWWVIIEAESRRKSNRMAGREGATQNGCAHLERPPGVIPAIHDSGHGGLVETDIERQVAPGVLEAQRRGLAAEQNRTGCPHAGPGDGGRATLGTGRTPHARPTRPIPPEFAAIPFT